MRLGPTVTFSAYGLPLLTGTCLYMGLPGSGPVLETVVRGNVDPQNVLGGFFRRHAIFEGKPIIPVLKIIAADKDFAFDDLVDLGLPGLKEFFIGHFAVSFVDDDQS